MYRVSVTDTQTCATLRLECVWTVNTTPQVLTMKIKEAKNFFEGRNEVIKIEGVRKYCRDEGEKSPYTWLFVGGIRTLRYTM